MNKQFIDNIEIKNFKCFIDFKAKGFKRVNLIGGKNNIGKTAFMEACYMGRSTEDKSSFFHALLVLELSRNPLEEFNIVEDSNNFNFKFENSRILINNKQCLLDDLLTNELYDRPSQNYTSGIQEITQFFKGKNKPLNIKNKVFISMNNIRADFIAECIDEMKLNDDEDKLNKILLELFDIKKIDVIKHQVMIKKDKEFVLLSEYGDGVKHFLNIVLALYLNKNSTIYLDEVDNGIHYTLFDELWNIIFKLSQEHNVQVFVTTHSKECIEVYNKISQGKDANYIELYKNKKTKLIVTKQKDNEQLEYELTQNIGVRGD